MQPMPMDSIRYPAGRSERNRNQWRRYAAVGSVFCGFIVFMVYGTRIRAAAYSKLFSTNNMTKLNVTAPRATVITSQSPVAIPYYSYSYSYYYYYTTPRYTSTQGYYNASHLVGAFIWKMGIIDLAAETWLLAYNCSFAWDDVY